MFPTLETCSFHDFIPLIPRAYFKHKPITTVLMCHRNILALLQLRGPDARNESGVGEANTACGAGMFSPRAGVHITDN